MSWAEGSAIQQRERLGIGVGDRGEEAAVLYPYDELRSQRSQLSQTTTQLRRVSRLERRGAENESSTRGDGFGGSYRDGVDGGGEFRRARDGGREEGGVATAECRKRAGDQSRARRVKEKATETSLREE